jgi:hypothetical protein
MNKKGCCYLDGNKQIFISKYGSQSAEGNLELKNASLLFIRMQEAVEEDPPKSSK